MYDQSYFSNGLICFHFGSELVITFEARASTGGRNFTEEVGDDTQPCEELDASLTISIEAVGDISLAEPWEPRDLPEPLLILRDIIREILGETTSGLDVAGGDGTRGCDDFELTLPDDVCPVTSTFFFTTSVLESLFSNGVPLNKSGMIFTVHSGRNN